MIMMALANSLGWMLMGPTWSHRWAPRALFPTSITASSIRMLKMYRGRARLFRIR